MLRYPWAGVLGVVARVDDELADVVVFQAVENRRALPAGADQPCHPQLREVLGNGRRRLAHVLGEFVDRHLVVG